MRAVVRSTAILGGTSVVSIMIGLVSAKAFAVLLEPGGLGFMGLLQSVLGLSTLIGGMGIGVGVTRAGASALARGDLARMAALRAAAWMSLSALGVLMALIVVACRAPISRWMLGGPEHGWSLLLAGPAVLLTLTSGASTSLLNAHQRIEALAKISILTKVLGAAITILLVWLWRVEGVAPAILVVATVGWGLAYRLLVREVGPGRARPAPREVADALWSLLRFGAPYTASMLVGTGVQLALPVLVLHALGGESVGFYRAAVGVSLGYLDFLSRAMSQDYFPRVSAAKDQPETLVGLVNQQHRLVMLLSAPLILGTLALLPYLIPLVYSPLFRPAIVILEWQLVADLLRFSSWTMAFVILARCGSATFFVTELVGGATLLAASWFGMRWFGLAGLGIAAVATYAIYHLVVWGVVRREIRLSFSAENRGLLLGALLAAAVLQLLAFGGFPRLTMVVGVGIAGLAGLVGARRLWREVRR